MMKVAIVVLSFIFVHNLAGSSLASGQTQAPSGYYASPQIELYGYKTPAGQRYDGVSIKVSLGNVPHESRYFYPAYAAESYVEGGKFHKEFWKLHYDNYQKNLREKEVALAKTKRIEDARTAAIRNQTAGSAVKQSLFKFPLEKAKFALAQYMVEQHMMFLDSDLSGDPRRITGLAETVGDPISSLGFAFFMLASGLGTHAIEQMGYSNFLNLNLKNRALLFETLPYAGPSFGLVASQMFHEVSDTFKACTIARLKYDPNTLLADRDKMRAEVERLCDEAWHAWRGEEIAKRYIPSIMGLALGNLLAPTSIALAKKMTPRGIQAFLVEGFEIVATREAGVLMISGLRAILGVANLAYFLVLDQFITPYLTRGYAIAADSSRAELDRIRGVDLGTKANVCKVEVKKDPQYEESKILRVKKPVNRPDGCMANLSEDILNWKMLHNSWRLNINSEFEGARQGYAKLVHNVTRQYATAQSYYLGLLKTRLVDKIDQAKLNAGITAQMNASTVQDHIQRKYPFFGVFVTGKDLQNPYASRESIAKDVSEFLLGDVADLESGQARQVRTLLATLLAGIGHKSEAEKVTFVSENFGLFEPLFYTELAVKSIDWSQSAGLKIDKKIVRQEDKYQWIKETLLKDDGPKDTREQFFSRVVLPILEKSSSLWRNGLNGVLNIPGYFTPDEQKILSAFASEASVGVQSGKTMDLAHTLVSLNSLIDGSSEIRRVLNDPDTHRYLSIIRFILGEPRPILTEGMAFPYIFTAQVANTDSMNPQNYLIPQRKYGYYFKSVADYLNHEMLCGGETGAFEWEFGYDAIFHPPRLTQTKAGSGQSFCNPKLVTSQMNYELQYQKNLKLFDPLGAIGIVPNILRNLTSWLKDFDVNQIFAVKDTKEQNRRKAELHSRIETWWEANATDHFFHLLAKFDKNYFRVHAKLQENLRRDQNTARAVSLSSWANFVNPLLERLKKGDALPYNVGLDLAVEWENYLKLLNALNTDGSFNDEILNLQKSFVSSFSYLMYQNSIDDLLFRGNTFRIGMNREIIKKGQEMTNAINAIKPKLDQQWTLLSDNLNAGLMNVNQALHSYMNSAVLAMYDPSSNLLELINRLKDTKSQGQVEQATKGRRH